MSKINFPNRSIFGLALSLTLINCSGQIETNEDVTNLDCAALYNIILVETVTTGVNAEAGQVAKWIEGSVPLDHGLYFTRKAMQEESISIADEDLTKTTMVFEPILYERMLELSQLAKNQNMPVLDTLINTCGARYHPSGEKSPETARD